MKNAFRDNPIVSVVVVLLIMSVYLLAKSVVVDAFHVDGAGWLYLDGLMTGNLLIPIVVHAAWNIIVKMTNGLISDVRSSGLLAITHDVQKVLLFIAMPLYAGFIAAKAEPFYRKM